MGLKGGKQVIRVNGEALEGAENMNIAALLRRLDYPDRMIAVECNGEIIPKGKWENTLLKDGDAVEVVRFVGGG